MGTPRNAGDVPTMPVLRYIASLQRNHPGHTRGTNFEGFDNSVLNAMPPGTTQTVAIAKMRRLYRAGLVRGEADKHARGDWELTTKGWTALLIETDNTPNK